MDRFGEYVALCRRGWEDFLKEGPTAALAFSRDQAFSAPRKHANTINLGAITQGMMAAARDGKSGPYTMPSGDLRVYEIAKREGTPHAQMITLGRTANNDIVLADASVSRFHIYFQQVDREWKVADAGSRNGSKLDGEALASKTLTPISSGSVLKLGELKGTFLNAPDLFSWLTQRLS